MPFCDARPLVVSCGLGWDSCAMLIEMRRRGVRPDRILFADVGDGGEHDGTYAWEPVFQQWLKDAGFPPIVWVKYRTRASTPYRSLEGNCLANQTLPSLAFGPHGCSQKWKGDPQRHDIQHWQPAIDAWALGLKVVKAIGYDDGGRDNTRACKFTFKIDPAERKRYDFWFPLQEWGIDRSECGRIILAAGLPLPPKSSCFFCPAKKKAEIIQFAIRSPAKMMRALQMEQGYLTGKHFKPGASTTVGLGRRFSWLSVLKKFIAQDRRSAQGATLERTEHETRSGCRQAQHGNAQAPAA